MYKSLRIALVCATAMAAPWAQAAPGQYWEMTIKMEMPGMPMAMPAQTHKVCVAEGSERDPKHTADKDCVITDSKVNGNKTSWKVQCNRNGEFMNGSGEMTGTPDNSEGVIRLSGTTGGQKFDMTQTYKSKRIGGTCESDEALKKAQATSNAVMGQLCDTKGKSTQEMLGQSHSLLDERICPGKKQPFCDMLRRETSRDYKAYAYMAQIDKSSPTGKISVQCGIDLEATTRSMCKTLSSSNVNALAPHCPAEVKVYRDNERRKSCEGRSYTAREDLSKCLAGFETGQIPANAGGASPVEGATKETTKGSFKF